LGTAEKFQIWRAVFTYDQPKMSSFSVIRGYVWFLSLNFFEFHHESLIILQSDDKIVSATYLVNNKGLNNKVKSVIVSTSIK
jgi:hypothetical protein